MSSIFLSYDHEDWAFVNNLKIDLERYDVRVWVDEDNIEIGDKLTDAIEKAITDMDYFGVVWSRHSINSPWVKLEVGEAQRWKKRDTLRPIKRGNVKLSDYWEGIRYANFASAESYEYEFKKLARSIGIRKSRLDNGLRLPPCKGHLVSVPTLLADSIKRGECILFVGPGASALSSHSLEGFQRFEYHDAPPSSIQLARRFAGECDYSNDDGKNLRLVASYYENLRGREKLIEAVSEVHDCIEPSPILHMLASMPFPIIVTTNYDQLFDTALSKSKTREGLPKRPYTLVYERQGDNPTGDVPDPSEERPLFFKLFGDIGDPSSVVLTEDDYRHFTQRMSDKDVLHPVPRTIRYRMMRWPKLFVGYESAVNDFRLIVESLHWRVDPAKIPVGFVLDSGLEGSFAGFHKSGITKENLWDFVPSLYKEVIGREYKNE